MLDLKSQIINLYFMERYTAEQIAQMLKKQGISFKQDDKQLDISLAQADEQLDIASEQNDEQIEQLKQIDETLEHVWEILTYENQKKQKTAKTAIKAEHNLDDISRQILRLSRRGYTVLAISELINHPFDEVQQSIWLLRKSHIQIYDPNVSIQLDRIDKELIRLTDLQTMSYIEVREALNLTQEQFKIRKTRLENGGYTLKPSPAKNYGRPGRSHTPSGNRTYVTQDEYQTLFKLYYIQKLPINTIAKEMQISPPSLRVALRDIADTYQSQITNLSLQNMTPLEEKILHLSRLGYRPKVIAKLLKAQEQESGISYDHKITLEYVIQTRTKLKRAGIPLIDSNSVKMLDELEIEILKLLVDNSDLSAIQLAHILNQTLGAIKTSIQHMKELGYFYDPDEQQETSQEGSTNETISTSPGNNSTDIER